MTERDLGFACVLITILGLRIFGAIGLAAKEIIAAIGLATKDIIAAIRELRDSK